MAMAQLPKNEMDFLMPDLVVHCRVRGGGTAGLPLSLRPSDVRSDDRHHRHISCVICAQSAAPAPVLLRLQKQRGSMPASDERKRQGEIMLLFVCELLWPRYLTIRDLQPRWPKGDHDGRTRTADGGGRTDGYPVHQLRPFWTLECATRVHLPLSLVSPSLRRESHMAPRLNGSVALDRLSAPAGLSGPAVMGGRARG